MKKFVDVNIYPIRLLTTQRNRISETMISVGLVCPCLWIFIHGDKFNAHSCMQTSKTHVMCWIYPINLYETSASFDYKSRFSFTPFSSHLDGPINPKNRIISFHLLFVAFFRLIYATNEIVIKYEYYDVHCDNYCSIEIEMIRKHRGMWNTSRLNKVVEYVGLSLSITGLK